MVISGTRDPDTAVFPLHDEPFGYMLKPDPPEFGASSPESGPRPPDRMTRRRDPTVPIELGPGPGRVRLIVTTLKGETLRVPMRGRRLRVGSSPDADLILEDPHVSRMHCELEPGPMGLTLRDLGSMNGTFVGGAQVREVVLTPGALVT